MKPTVGAQQRPASDFGASDDRDDDPVLPPRPRFGASKTTPVWSLDPGRPWGWFWSCPLLPALPVVWAEIVRLALSVARSLDGL